MNDYKVCAKLNSTDEVADDSKFVVSILNGVGSDTQLYK